MQGATVAVPLSRDPTAEDCALVVQELVKHFLYMRNQIPGLFNDLYWQCKVRLKRLLSLTGHTHIYDGDVDDQWCDRKLL